MNRNEKESARRAAGAARAEEHAAAGPQVEAAVMRAWDFPQQQQQQQRGGPAGSVSGRGRFWLACQPSRPSSYIWARRRGCRDRRD
jgi:hypothetical protein